jgi:bifunctional non-homologous end joining protein LigD
VSLVRYRSKRDFSRTNEPRGKAKSTAKPDAQKVLFIVQKHAATRLHFDFRLEVDGVLKSWAVPKGFPFAHADKRLAMQVEDHPREYAKFEGVIPPGNYGAGTVMLWDAGICEFLDDPPQTGLRKGKLHLDLNGQKLKGIWRLVRMKPGEDRDENAWLIIKSGESVKPISARQEDKSVVSGRTMKQIASMADATWESDKKTSKGRLGRNRERTLADQKRR